MTNSVLGKIVIGLFAVIGGLTVLLVIGLMLVGIPSTSVASPGIPLSSTPVASLKHDWSTYEVRVEGERISINGVERTDVEFKGGCLVSAIDGSNESKSITGSTPQTFSHVGRGISCNYQKQRGNDEKLKVTVRRDGQIVKTVDTIAEYGIVSFAI